MANTMAMTATWITARPKKSELPHARRSWSVSRALPNARGPITWNLQIMCSVARHRSSWAAGLSAGARIRKFGHELLFYDAVARIAEFYASGESYLAPRHGFEPRFTAPKAAVLPL